MPNAPFEAASLASLVRTLIERELETDRFFEDVTGALLGDQSPKSRAVVCNREPITFAGETVVKAFRELFSGRLTWECGAEDGEQYATGSELVRFFGEARLCLAVERTLVNFLSHTCGVATLTRKFVDAVKGTPAKILATRKTLPGLREIQLYSVVCGGGSVHRRSLADGILIKENHSAILPAQALLERARNGRSPLHGIEIEVQSLDELMTVLETPPDVVMLDNFSEADLAKAVPLVKGRCRIEVSGGITLERVSRIAALGVDYISVGALTHSARIMNLSMDISQH